jgi:hypothetical protein
MDNNTIIALLVAGLFGVWLVIGIVQGDKEVMSKQMRAHIDKEQERHDNR